MGRLKLCRLFNDGKTVSLLECPPSSKCVHPKMMLSVKIGYKRPLDRDCCSVINNRILVDRHLARAHLPSEYMAGTYINRPIP